MVVKLLSFNLNLGDYSCFYLAEAVLEPNSGELPASKKAGPMCKVDRLPLPSKRNLPFLADVSSGPSVLVLSSPGHFSVHKDLSVPFSSFVQMYML